MFKNAIVFRIPLGFSFPEIAAVEAELQKATFIPCGLTQELSSGWTPPRGEANGALLESVAGQWILKLMSERKKVPGEVLTRRVDEQSKIIEDTMGRKPGKKEKREIKDDAMLELLPQAFATRGACTIWIDPVNRFLVLGASSKTQSDAALTALSKVFEGLSLMPLQTTESPAACMSVWLVNQDAPAGFSVDRECEIKATDESKAIVKYGNHSLDIEEICDHIRGGKVPTKLAMTWQGRMSFVLTDDFSIKKISFGDVVFEKQSDSDKDSGFDADVAIFTGEFSKMIPDMILALGGEMKVQAE
jgi:recombination associated protein RdgC